MLAWVDITFKNGNTPENWEYLDELREEFGSAEEEYVRDNTIGVSIGDEGIYNESDYAYSSDMLDDFEEHISDFIMHDMDFSDQVEDIEINIEY